MAARAKDELGRRGEALAAEALSRAGYRILDRNWRCREGELDLVVQRGAETAVIEVKTRSGTGFGHPFEAITARKLARLQRLAVAWCHEREHRATVRLDAVAVTFNAQGDARIEHLRGIG